MDYDENVMAMMNAATPDRLKREGGVLTIDVGLGVGTVPGEVFDGESAALVTEAELAEVERLDAAPLHETPVPEQRLQELGLTLLPRLARAHRRVCAERDSGILTDDLIAPAVAKAEQAAYLRGRCEAIEEAAEWLVDRARTLEDQCDDECDGQDADRFLDLAKSYRETSKAMLSELNAKGPDRGK